MGPFVTHGALDHAELAARGLDAHSMLDFSSNLNPFGPPPGVREALAALDPAPYPDHGCLALRERLATQHDVDPARILVGNGSNELLHLIARALLHPATTALVVAPAYGEYAYASRLVGAEVVEWRAGANPPFAVDTAALIAHIERLRPRITWLCAPNNPTGADLPASGLDALAVACAAQRGLLVVDRAYHALGPREQPEAAVDPALPVLHVHSLTKSYSLAGLRLGYLLGDAAVLQQVASFQPTWSVNSAAQAAGLAALADTSFLSATRPRVWAASDELMAGIDRLGLESWRGTLPFLLVNTGDGAATRGALLRRGRVVRDCASFGLPAWVRVAPRRPADNARLLAAWKELI